MPREASCKDNYRRDLNELERRGVRERPSSSPSYDADLETRAIKQRADAWSRIADHYVAIGDREAEAAIRAYVDDHFDYHKTEKAVKRPERSDPNRER